MKIFFDDMTDEKNLSIYTDKEKISEVVYNLVTNAINHSGSDEILVILKREDNNIVLVIDNGSGIRKDVEKKLFTKFVTTSPSGLGLGLYISKNIIEAHGGKIWAENNVNGSGATFGFNVPTNRVEKNDHQ